MLRGVSSERGPDLAFDLHCAEDNGCGLRAGRLLALRVAIVLVTIHALDEPTPRCRPQSISTMPCYGLSLRTTSPNLATFKHR